MINKRSTKAFCCEDISKIENYDQAIADNSQTWDIHHRREITENKTKKQLIEENLYYNRPADELIFITKAEHIRLHKLGNTYWIGKHHSEETKQKMRKPRSEETKQKMSEAKRGEKHPAYGTHWWNNGVESVKAKECPGPEWERGRLRLVKDNV